MGLRTKPSQRQKRLGQELRRLREQSDVPTSKACRLAGLQKPHLSHIEAGRTGCSEQRLRTLLDAYGCRDGTLIEVLVEMASATGKGWWSDYKDIVDERGRDLAEVESSATGYRSFQWLFVPGLLQTPDYMRSLFTNRLPEMAQDVLARYVDFRLRRQQVLTEEPLPTYHAVIHEAAFHMHFVDRKTMRDQLAYLVEVSQFPNITIQLLPFKAESHPVTPGAPFTIHDARAPELRTVHVEQPISPLFLGDRQHLDQFMSDFTRLSNMALAPLNAAESHEETSFALIQHLRYVL